MNRKVVRRFGLFGKSRPRPSKYGNSGWGTRKGSKAVKAYYKKEIDSFRVELELRARFLRSHEIRDPFDFRKLAALLPRRHILFARFDEGKLTGWLRKMGLEDEPISETLLEVRQREGDLWTALRYLRSRLGLKNTRRLLVPLKVNRLVRRALEEWAELWPSAATRLEAKRAVHRNTTITVSPVPAKGDKDMGKKKQRRALYMG